MSFVSLKIDRSQEGHIRCWETVEPYNGMTWSMDGSFEWTGESTGGHRSHREPLSEVREPRVAYSVPGPKLLDARVPEYAPDVDQGATVQISAHAVLEEPHRVALQLVLVPRGEEPYHRETVGDRRFDDGNPDLWIVLDRRGDDPSDVAAVQRVLRWPPPIRAEAKP
jgi:hypothetical protein